MDFEAEPRASSIFRLPSSSDKATQPTVTSVAIQESWTADQHPRTGTFTAPGKGRLCIRLDNRHSYMRSKSITYKVTFDWPNPSPASPASPAAAAAAIETPAPTATAETTVYNPHAGAKAFSPKVTVL